MRNTGNVELTNVVVTDNKIGTICAIGSLAIGASSTCTRNGTALLGQYANIGTVTGDYAKSDGSGGTGQVTDDDWSYYFGTTIPPTLNPAINIVKTVDTGAIPGAIPGGQTTEVTWTITVTNTGDVPLSSVIVSDALVPDCNWLVGSLAVGASATETCVSPHTPSTPTWTFTNVAIATGIGSGTTVIATDDAIIGTTLVAASATIGDTVWSDENDNRVQDNGEKGIAGAQVRLTLPDNSTLYATTNASGRYLFAALDPGTYKVELILSSIAEPNERSLRITTARSFTINLVEGQTYIDADFGVVATLPNTGIDADVILAIAIALVIAGGAALLLTIGKREDGDASA